VLVRAQNTDEILLFADEAVLVPLPLQVHAAGLGQFAGLVEGDAGLAIVRAPEDVEAGQVADLAGEAVAQNLAHGVIGGDGAHVLQQAVGTDDVALVVHHLLVFPEDLDGGGDGGDEEIRAAEPNSTI